MITHLYYWALAGPFYIGDMMYPNTEKEYDKMSGNLNGRNKMFKQTKKTEIIKLEGYHSIDGKGYDIGLVVSIENNELQHYSINTKHHTEDWDSEFKSDIKPAINVKLVSLAMAEILKIDEQCRLPEKG